LDKVLTAEYLNEVITATKKKIVSTDEAERQIIAARRSLEDLNIAIQRTLNTIEKTGSEAAQERLKQREAEKIQVKQEIERLSAELAAAQVEFTPTALDIIARKWRDQFAEAQKSEDITVRKDALMRFVSRVDLGYNKVMISYTYPMTELFQGKQAESALHRGGTSL
jgi:transposase